MTTSVGVEAVGGRILESAADITTQQTLLSHGIRSTNSLHTQEEGCLHMQGASRGVIAYARRGKLGLISNKGLIHKSPLYRTHGEVSG